MIWGCMQFLKIYNYGISPNKWGTYFLSGLCVLTISVKSNFLTKNKIDTM